MKLYFKRGVVIGFIITILTISGLGIYSYVNISKLIDGGSVLGNSLRITNYAEKVLVTTIDLETGQRGYLITGDSSYLEPYDAALESIDDNVEQLLQATSTHPKQRVLVDSLKTLVWMKMDIVKKTVEARRKSFEDAQAVVKGGEGKMLMDKIRGVIANIQSLESSTYDEQDVANDTRLGSFRYSFTAMLVLPAIVVMILFYSINNNLTRRELANISLQKANADVTQLNKDLESFTYSVSHDLRAPLRSVNGYANVLIEDYGEQLDDEAKRVIGVIAKNGRRMGQLIDDLLNFSRLGRKELQLTAISMDVMVHSVIDEIRETGENLNAQIDVQALPAAKADMQMMRQVWHNLIANALKYSGKNDKPVITIGSTEQEGDVVYFVKDNGVGFNMLYVDKLFGVFQRLHKSDEFEGTGVGLALVKRITDRHKGRVWAEGELGKGATFYFSLPA